MPCAMSPGGNSAAIVGRKRRSRDEVVDDIPGESSGTRKSLRGAGVKSTRGKRPKLALANIWNSKKIMIYYETFKVQNGLLSSVVSLDVLLQVLHESI